jgi:flagellar hook assembly protein FlgD
MSSGSKYLKVNPGDTQILVAAQLIARGSNNRNSVTKLKQLSDCVQSFYDSTFLIGVNNISTEIPQQYKLYQNYPNPFNPSTTIKFDIQANGKRQMTNVKLVIYDVSGKEAETLIDKELNSGSYSADWNASSFASGVYFYSLIINGNRFETSKMVLLK